MTPVEAKGRSDPPALEPPPLWRSLIDTRRRFPLHSVLTDARLDRRLGRDGFAKVQVLDAATAGDLRRVFGELHGWNGDGFVTDACHPDRAYRRKAADAIAEVVTDPLAGIFADHEPATCSFAVKWPHQAGRDDLDGFPQTPHRDWTYTDERAGIRSHVVWIALEDVEGPNGQLRVARGSHRLDRMVRGTDLEPGWRVNDDVWRRRLLSVPVRAGEAVVFDSGLFHCSWPNHTTRPRVVAAVVVRPKGAPLFHFARIDEHTAARHDVDEEVFLRVRGDEMRAAIPTLPTAAVVPTGEIDLTPRQLAARLDLQPLAWLDRAHSAGQQARRGGGSAVRSLVATRVTDGEKRLTSPEGRRAGSTLAHGLSALNQVALRRASAGHQGVWDPSELPWTAEVEAAFPAVREEVESLLDRSALAPIDQVAQADQGNTGTWRALQLMRDGRVIDEASALLPFTTGVMQRVPGVRGGGLSLLEPGTTVPPHSGPDAGVLRYHLGLIVPDATANCGLRVDGQVLSWKEGGSILFDDASSHGAWNHGEADRVVLVIDVDKPLPSPLRALNRLARRAQAAWVSGA